MAKRKDSARDEYGVWGIGGGALEFGDSVDETLRREIREEYGTDVLDSEFLGFRDVHRSHGGKNTHWIALDFKVYFMLTRKKLPTTNRTNLKK